MLASHNAPHLFARWVTATQPMTDALAWVVIGISQVTAEMGVRGLGDEAPGVTNAIALDWVLLVLLLAWGVGRSIAALHTGDATHLSRQIAHGFQARGNTVEGLAIRCALLLPLLYFVIGTKFVLGGRSAHPYYGEGGLIIAALWFTGTTEVTYILVTLWLVRGHLRSHA